MNGTVVLALLVPIIAHLYGRIRRLEGAPPPTLHESMMTVFLLWAIIWAILGLPPVLSTDSLSAHDKIIWIATVLGMGLVPPALYLLFRSTLRLVRRWEGRA